MRKYISIGLLTVALAGAFAGCKKDEAAPSYPTLKDYLQSKPELSTFAAALEKANLQSFRDGQGPFTWFAPTNDAFIDAKLTADSINKLTPSQLSYILMYHLINPTSVPLTPVYTKDMVAENSFSRTTQLGQSIFVGNYLDSFYVNGFALRSTNNNVANGVVHVTSSLNVPPNLRGNLFGILNATGQHSLFLAAVARANRTSLLTGTAVYTVIAPTDAAMTAAGYTTTSIATIPVASMDSVVRYHMFSGSRLFSNDFGNKITPAVLLSSTRRLQGSNRGRALKGQNNPTPVNIIVPNILGTNGVVHVTDGVLRY